MLELLIGHLRAFCGTEGGSLLRSFSHGSVMCDDFDVAYLCLCGDMRLGACNVLMIITEDIED